MSKASDLSQLINTIVASLAGKAASAHTHVISAISNAGAFGASMLAAADLGAARGLLSISSFGASIAAAADAAAVRTLLGGIAAFLPTQTGQAGKVLTTDGTNLSWGAAFPKAIAAAFIKGNVAEAAQIQGTAINLNTPTRSGTGQYDIAFTTAAPNADYLVFTTPSNQQAINGSVAVSLRTVNGFRLNFSGYTGGSYVASDCDFSLKVEVTS